jgi:hypothetical protein
MPAHHINDRSKRDREQARATRKARKAERFAIRRAERAEAYLGHPSDINPTGGNHEVS